MPDSLHMVDGSMDWSGGVDSSKVTTIQSDSNPNGLTRNQLAWLVNGTLRDGAILTRTGWQYLKTIFPSGNLYQGGMMYEPPNADPYLLLSIGGRIYQVPCNTGPSVDLSAVSGLVNPATETIAYFCQAEQFAIIQAGDYLTAATPTLPLFYWDGAPMIRSNGIIGAGAVPPNPKPWNQIPAAGPMDYYMGRLWYAQDYRTYAAGDIVQGAAGNPAFENRDAVLFVTENPICLGGDGFVVPSSAGTIRAIKHSANLDTALGQGQLFIGTNKAIYTLDVPISRTAWIAADNNYQPLQKVIQITNGTVGDRSVVAVNGDLFYQALDPSIRSLITAVRYFSQWGNTPISANLERLLNYQDRALMRYSTGIEFENRLLMGMRPEQTAEGVVHKVIVPLDFTPVATLGNRLPPCWEGHWEGISILQLFSGNFGGVQRAFAIVRAENDGSIQLWEITNFLRWDYSTQGQNRITTVIEFPAYNFGKPFDMKKLVSAELWLDKLLGTVDFHMEYRPDADVCWYDWHTWQLCSQADCNDDPVNWGCYPTTPYRESHRSTITLPKPPLQCQTSGKHRPAWQGYQFQCRLTIKGWCRVRGLLLHAEPMDKKLYKDMVCATAPAAFINRPAVAQVFVTEQTEQPLLTEDGNFLVPE